MLFFIYNGTDFLTLFKDYLKDPTSEEISSFYFLHYTFIAFKVLDISLKTFKFFCSVIVFQLLNYFSMLATFSELC